MQVMLNVFNVNTMSYLRKMNIIMHLRMPVTYFYIAGLFKFTADGTIIEKVIRNLKAKGNIKNISTHIFNELLKVFVRGPINNPTAHALNAQKRLRALIKLSDIDGDFEGVYYKKTFGVRGKLVMQGLFYSLSLGLLIQSLYQSNSKGDENRGLKLIDIIAAGHTSMTIGHSIASGYHLFARSRALWKNVPVDSITFAKAAEGIGEKLGHALIFTAVIMSWMEMEKYAEEGNIKGKERAWFDARVGIMMATGYALKNYTKNILLRGGAKILARFVVREVALAAANAVPVLGTVLFVIGSVISFVWLIIDIVGLLAGLVEDWIYGSPQFDLFGDHWESFKAEIKKSSLEQILVKHAKDKDMLPQLLLTEARKSRLKDVFDFNPYLTYTSTSKKSSNDILVKNLDEISDLRRDYGWFDSGVDWEPLNWRALVPLYKVGVDLKTLVKAVTFYDSFVNIADMPFKHKELIKYYISLRNVDNGFNEKELDDFMNFKCKKLSAGTIATLLEMGKFTMREGMQIPMNWKIDEKENPFKDKVNSGVIKIDNYQLYIPEKYSYYGLEDFPKYLASEVYKKETIGKGISDINSLIQGSAQSFSSFTISNIRNGTALDNFNIELKKLDEKNRNMILKMVDIRLHNWRKVFSQSQHDFDMAVEHGKKENSLKNGYIIENWINNPKWAFKFDFFTFGAGNYIKEGEAKKLNDAVKLLEGIHMIDYKMLLN